MVVFENININQRVEVLRDGQICTGTVKFKGVINGISGEWVGVELDLPGTNSGLMAFCCHFLYILNLFYVKFSACNAVMLCRQLKTFSVFSKCKKQR